MDAKNVLTEAYRFLPSGFAAMDFFLGSATLILQFEGFGDLQMEFEAGPWTSFGDEILEQLDELIGDDFVKDMDAIQSKNFA